MFGFVEIVGFKIYYREEKEIIQIKYSEIDINLTHKALYYNMVMNVNYRLLFILVLYHNKRDTI